MTLGALEPAGRWRPHLVDAVLAVVLAVAIGLASSAKIESNALDPDVWAYLFAVALGALMLVRRRWPALVLVATVALLFAYYTIGYPAVGVGVPIAGALFSAAEFGRLRLAVVVATAVMVLSTAYRISEGEEITKGLLAFDVAANLVLLVAVIALGDSIRSRRELRQRAIQEAERVALEHQRAARRQVEQERLAIARELHDVLAHTVAAISLQAGVALEALPDEPDNATLAVRRIRQVSSAALTELRSTVRALRDPSLAGRQPPGGLADLDRLADTAAEAGLTVAVKRTGEPSSPPVVVDAAAHRIVQESITNVLRHSGSTDAVVEVDYRPDAVRLRITDHGGMPAPERGDGARHDSANDTDDLYEKPAVEGGFGITGMRERVELLGGTLHAAGTADGGFQVLAVLPFAANRLGAGP